VLEAELVEATRVGSGGTAVQRSRRHGSKTTDEAGGRREATASDRRMTKLEAPAAPVEEERWVVGSPTVSRSRQRCPGIIEKEVAAAASRRERKGNPSVIPCWMG
jgi:hypothetical protein